MDYGCGGLAMTQAQPKPLTFAQYLAQDKGTDRRYELTHGVLIDVPPESDDNISLALGLAEYLKQVVSWRLLRTHATTLQVPSLPGVPQENRFPDLMVLTPELAAQLKGKSSAITFAMPNPALVVEVVSPYRSSAEDNYRRDYIDKRQQYEQRGIAEYWIVDPTSAQVTVLVLAPVGYQTQVFKGKAQITSSAFPTLSLSVDQLFALGHE
ncbi:MAG: Uma2 family endonuclease [Tildeniella torsiva UHER 1998/13D]|jgi:Uma2 family endonuclease|nr:Uma2 family endonuclease [Tildeniella torsiva UHER 1998/13D]